MLKFLKNLLLYAFALLAVFIAIVIIIGFAVSFLFSSDSRGCTKDSQAANYVRSLSQDRLEKLFEDMDIYSAREDLPFDGYYVHQEKGLPPEFQDLEVVRVRPRSKNIMVEGCFDHYLYLRFHTSENGVKTITMQYGEHDIGTEVVWSSE